MLLFKRATPILRVSLTPLVDVVFILLLFFMLSSSFHRFHFTKIQSSATERSTLTASEREVVQLLVRQDGTVQYRSQFWSIDSVEFRRAIEQWRREGASITVGAEQRASIQQLVSALGELDALGVEALRLFPSVRSE